jgi:hypothetical protein
LNKSHLTFYKRGLRYVLYALVILTPALAGLLLMQQAQGESLFRSYPVWTDEVWYWHQAQSFAEAGFNSGYYTIKEVPAQAQFSPFNPWGVSTPVLYGTIAALFGWSLHSIVIINLLALTGALVLFVWALRPSVIQALLCVVLLAIYPPLILYTYSSLLTVMQIAIGIALAAGFLVVLRHRELTPRPVLLALVTGIALATLIRVTWAVWYVPLVLLVSERITWRRWIAAFSVAGVAFLAGTLVFTQTGAPYPNLMSEVFASADDGLSAMLTVILDNAQNNLALLDSGDTFEVVQRQQIAIFSMLLIVSAGWHGLRHCRKPYHRTENRLYAIGLIMFGLGVLSVLTLLLYDVKLARDFRLFAPVLLVGLLLTIACKQWGVVVPVLISMILALPATLHIHTIWTDWHVDPAGRNAYYAWNAEIAKQIQYDPDAPNRWCNTLLHSHPYVWSQTYVLLAVPAGIGLTTTFEQQDMPPPYQSRWLMFTDAEMSQYEAMLDVVPLLDVPDGKIYYNRDSACPLPAP